ncbi:MAG: CDP-alcohol phosphatidyltransferase family protein [Lachnospiraceae bacterium]|nr:CDP-alcohol phosphatidyltransferase family protein [Lachnospiraceae bacterium]
MIGFYNYTMLLTYFSLISASLGIIFSLSDTGHPFIGCFFLLFSGFCDAFDGKVARTKKNRTSMEKEFGIQIDSLSDLVAFGVLPACIGVALMRNSRYFEKLFDGSAMNWQSKLFKAVCFAVLVLYVLAALIRLAYYNVTEQERQQTETGDRKHFVGLPVTSSALIFPFILLFHYILPADVTPIYMVAVLVTGFLFVFKFKVPKFGIKGVLALVGIGVVEFILLMVWKIMH